ncbi:MAG: hypothetical protein JWO06_2774 [Bacteroidota bacterium]|nr:hypothetical protein [Bacteroidota bacterium]
MKQITGFTVFTTQRLVLRQLNDSDAPALAMLRSNARVNQYLKRPAECSIETAIAFVKKMTDGNPWDKRLYWAISLKDEPTLIGTICLWNFSEDGKTAEIGYELNPVFYGQGIMSEALSRIIDYSFNTLGLSTLEAYTRKNNTSSIRLLEKYRFKVVQNRKDTNDANNVIYSLSTDVPS